MTITLAFFSAYVDPHYFLTPWISLRVLFRQWAVTIVLCYRTRPQLSRNEQSRFRVLTL